MSAQAFRKRLDFLLVERGLAESVPKAAAMILAGEVLVDGARAAKAGMQVEDSARIEIRGRAEKYASRAGLKLEGALGDFNVDPSGRICLDIGASTGGFTDCLLQHGATRVYAVDVNVKQLAWKLRRDPRVIPVEGNARSLRRDDVPEPVQLVTVDVSFISVTKVLRPAASACAPDAELLVLIKPQFELPRGDVPAGGIVRDAALHEKSIKLVRDSAVACKLEVFHIRPSHVIGAEGNQEFFLHARKKVA